MRKRGPCMQLVVLVSDSIGMCWTETSATLAGFVCCCVVFLLLLNLGDAPGRQQATLTFSSQPFSPISCRPQPIGQ